MPAIFPARIVVPDAYPMTEEPSALLAPRTPTSRLLGRGLLTGLPSQRDRAPPAYVSLPPTQNGVPNSNTPRKCKFFRKPTTRASFKLTLLRTGTQVDQDETDEKERRKAMNELVASWMDRLQLISVIVASWSSHFHVLRLIART